MSLGAIPAPGREGKTMEFKYIIYDQPEPGIGRMTLNRPDRLNAISIPMLDEMLALYEHLKKDLSVRVLIVTGAGRGFCSGADLMGDAESKGLAEQAPSAAIFLEKFQYRYSAMVTELRRIPQPVIAAVNGTAAGIGMCLALVADVIYAAPNTGFIASFANIGLSGGELGSSYLLPRLVGTTRASEILLTGRKVMADEAERIGMICGVVEQEKLMDTCMEKARLMLEKSPMGLRITKRVLDTNASAVSLEAAVDLENRNQSILVFTPEFLQAVMNFGKKKKQ